VSEEQVLAVVSKAVFEKQAPHATLGARFATDRYVSKNPGLRGLAEGGALFLVTVRPPDERLWLVAILESPRFDGEQWVAAENAVPMTDVTALVPRLKLATGQGIHAEPGKLGMSLQTPRKLTGDDAALLRGAIGGASATPAAKPTTKPVAKAEAAPAKPAKAAEKPAEKPTPPKPEKLATTADHLARALAAAEAGRHAEALQALVAQFAELPAAPLADAITAVGAVIDAAAPPLTGKTPKEREAAFQAAAAENRPERLGTLLACVTETKGSGETLVRLEALTSRTKDPRLAARIAGLIAAPPYNASVSRTLPFWKFLFATLPNLGDPRVLAWARGWPKAWAAERDLSELEREALTKRLAKILPELERAYAAPTLSAADEARCAAVLAAVQRAAAPAAKARAAKEKGEAELLADVYEHPDDDAPRLVYADYLQERNDPRGEFIVLQFRRRDGTLGRDEAKREKDLLAEHARRWLGGIAKLVKKTGMEFERGFLSACATDEIDDHREWNTVHTIRQTAPHRNGMPVKSLRVLEAIQSIDGLVRVTEPLGVTDLEWAGPYRDPYGDEGVSKKEVAVFRRLRCLPSLRRLVIGGWNAWCEEEIRPAHHAWIWTSPATAHLEDLSVRGRLRHLPAWRVVADEHALRRFQVDARTDEDNGLALAFERGADGALSRLVVSGDPQTRPYFNAGGEPSGRVVDAADAIAALPDDALVEIALHPTRRWKPTDAEKKQLARAMKRQRRWNGAL